MITTGMNNIERQQLQVANAAPAIQRSTSEESRESAATKITEQQVASSKVPALLPQGVGKNVNILA